MELSSSLTKVIRMANDVRSVNAATSDLASKDEKIATHSQANQQPTRPEPGD